MPSRAAVRRDGSQGGGGAHSGFYGRRRQRSEAPPAAPSPFTGGRAAGWMSYGTCPGRQPMDTAGNRPTFGDDSLRDGPVLPDIVIAPAHPAPHEPAEIVFEVRPGAEGIDVLPVFSSVRQLVATFGPAQPGLA